MAFLCPGGLLLSDELIAVYLPCDRIEVGFFCEFFPIEAVKTNVLGTENVSTAAI